MGIMPTWFYACCIVSSILVTIILFGFGIQTCIYKYNQRDELTTTYSILAVIGLIKILSSCTSSYIFTSWLITNDINTYFLLQNWVALVRIIALLSQMLFLVWRLELTFVRTNYELSRGGLIFYHIVIVVNLILFTILNMERLESDTDTYNYIYYPAQLMRLGVFFSVAYQFMNKLFDLIASQHSSNTEYNTSKHSRLITAVSKNHANGGDISKRDDVNGQLLNQLNDELKLIIESEMEKSSFTTKNYKLISIITKLSFLACIDFVTLFVYVTFAEIYVILLDNQVKLWITFFYIYYTIEPLSWVIYSLTVWFSFMFSENQYQMLFGCCHRQFINYFEKRAKKRTIKRTMATLPRRLSPIFGSSKQNEKSANSIELEMECSVMQD